MSIVIHWVLSESLFLLKIDFYDWNGMALSLNGTAKIGDPFNNGTMTGSGYSIVAMLVAIVLFGLMVLILFLLSLRKLHSVMPLVGNNSQLIGNACLRPDDDNEAASKRVKWGVVRQPKGNEPGHWCSTSFEVEEPIEGAMYNGLGGIGQHGLWRRRQWLGMIKHKLRIAR